MNNEHERPNGQQQEPEQHSERDTAREGEASPEVESREQPRIYVASLSDYNAGRLHGAWIDAAQEPDQIEAEIAWMLKQSAEPVAEEWAIHDHTGFSGVRLSEYEPIRRVSRIARGIVEHGPAFAAFVNHSGQDEPALERFEDCYLGAWPSRREFAEETLTDLGLDKLIADHLPDHFVPYVRFDADAYIRDVELNGDLTIIDSNDGKVFVFSG